MKKIALLFVILSLASCTDQVKSLTDLKSNFYEYQQTAVHMGSPLEITFGANEDKIDSVSILINGQAVKNKDILAAPTTHLGINQMEIYVYLKGNHIYGKTQLAVLNAEQETAVEFEVIKEHPHPKELFTQGLFVHNNQIYESAGQYKKSKLVSYQLGSTTYLKENLMEPTVFAEGATLFDNKIYQLTYRERKIFVYDVENLKLLDTLEMPAEIKEGWGITSTDHEFIVADGTQYLYFYTPDFKLNRKIQVVGNVSIYNNINELEYLDGKIFANVWQTPFILIINPETGAVEQYYDCREFNEAKGADDVLNGIAIYNGNLLFTGKHWSNIYEVNLPK